jgi:hypothetical protein
MMWMPTDGQHIATVFIDMSTLNVWDPSLDLLNDWFAT